ncbi:MAG: LysE family translocator [Anaerolineales bacterium]|jgi:threonine/homoserine/homoserine lactone efflux protein
MTSLSLGFFIPMEEWIALFLNSYLIGFAAAATLGPIAMLLIQRTLRCGRRVGMVSGVGVALADALYGLVGALGLTALTRILTEHQALVRVIGGGVLVFIGLRSLISRLAFGDGEEIEGQVPTGLWGALFSIFLLTLSNPMTILYFSAVYAGLAAVGGGASSSGMTGAGLFPLGVFTGSLSWWMILASLVAKLRGRFRVAQLIWLHRAGGVVIAGFGIWILFQVWFI